METKFWGMIFAIAGLASASPEALSADSSTTGSGALDEIVITGTRLITNGNDLPTPVTVVTAAEQLTTTPSDIPDALNKLPAFSLSRNSANLNNSTDNFTGNFLNLRGLGVQRNLILLDGHRVAPTSYSGAVDVDTLPEMLLERVDIVTGGASAVYGSDAVSGVVNYILDKKFEGFKAKAQYGISNFSDANSYRAGLAMGTNLFGDRGHFEFSYEHFHQKGIPDKADRPTGALGYAVAGNGTTADPFRLITNARNGVFGFNGSILSGPLAGQQFVSPGVSGPFNHGTNEGGTLESGGDGFYGKGSSITADQTHDQAFARFDFDVSESTKWYVQANYARAQNENNFYPLLLFTANGPPIVAMLSDNPYLSPATQAQLVDPFFIFGRTLDGTNWGVRSTTNSASVATGITSKIGNYNLELYYGRSQSTTYNNFTGDTIYGRLYAALDAVDEGLATTGTASGKIVCRASLTNSAYAGCIPLNPFGTTVASQQASLDWLRGSNYNRPKFTLDNLEASIAGPAFDSWAGPVQTALSANFRRLSMDVTAGFPAGTLADCNGIAPLNCQQGVTPYISNQITPVSAHQTVSEGALEANIPLLKDAKLAQSLDFSVAGRYTKYSTSGSVKSWKTGLDWQANDSVKIRATSSRDIRAPSLFDLYQPATNSSSGYQDLHTGFNGIVNTETGGNSTLVPEKADTLTAGIVLRPSGLEGFSVAIDYYQIKIKNAIANIDGRLASIQKLCEDSNGTSSFCSLYVRPNPFTDTSIANTPSLVKIQQLNASTVKTWGVDGEVNYKFAVSEGGRVTLRGLVGYQPSYKVLLAPGFTELDYAGAAATQGIGGVPKLRLTGMAAYNTANWSVALLERWRSSLKWDPNPTVVYAIPKIASVAYTDVTFNLTFGSSSRYDAFVSVQNVFNKSPPVYLTNGTSGTPDFSFPATSGDDVLGRYYTAGLRFKL